MSKASKTMMVRVRTIRMICAWVLTSILILAILAAVPASAGAPAAQPTAVFYGHWPYPFSAPIKLNSFLNDGFPFVLGMYADLIEPPSAYYLWATGEYRGLLAERWGFEDAQTYVVTLRNDATWSDGSRLTSRDMVATYTIGRLRNFQEFRYVATVAARDEHTVVFTLKRPSFIAERLILKQRIRPASVYGAIADEIAVFLGQGDNLRLADEGKLQNTDEWKALTKKLTDLRLTEIVASGPYALAAADVTDPQVVLRKNPASAFAGGVQFESVVLFRGNAEKVQARLDQGEITYSHDVFSLEAEAKLEAQGYTLVRTPTYGGPALMFEHDRYPLGRVELRQAMAHVLDRGKIAAAAFGESGKPMRYLTGISDLLLPRWLSQAAIGSLDVYAPDPDKAAALLTGAGFTKRGQTWRDDQGDALQFALNVPAEFPRYFETAQEIADQLNAFGMQVTVVPANSTQLLRDVSGGRFDILLWTWGVIGNPFPFNSYRNQFYSLNEPGLRPGDKGMAFPLTQTVNGESVDLAALIEATDAGIDLDSQRTAVTKLSQTYNSLLPLLPLYERYSNTPLLLARLNGIPSLEDPVFQNSVTADNYVVLWLLEGVLGPA